MIHMTMAYNFENGVYFNQIMEFARQAFATASDFGGYYNVQFRRATARTTCRHNACKEFMDFCMRYSKRMKDQDEATKGLFKEFCKTFHDDKDEVDAETYEQFSCIIGSSSLAIDPTIKQQFIRLICEIHVNKQAVQRVQHLVAQQRLKAVSLNTLRPKKNQPSIRSLDGNLEKHMACLEAVAIKVALKWNRNGYNINFNGLESRGKMGQGQRYFRMNLRCRMINFLREVFPNLDSPTRLLILKRFDQATTIFHMLPLLGCDILVFQDYPANRCIFKNTNSCCKLQNDHDGKLSFSSKEVKTPLAMEFAISDLAPYVYKACNAYNDIVAKKSRMSYTKAFKL